MFFFLKIKEVLYIEISFYCPMYSRVGTYIVVDVLIVSFIGKPPRWISEKCIYKYRDQRILR
jgi:hypothetical protein